MYCGDPDVGDLKLLDYQVTVGSTGITFVAALNGTIDCDGLACISQVQIDWTYHRAASQLAFMGLVRGDIFGFMRQSIPLTVDQAATLVGYTSADVIGWEDLSTPIPVAAWQGMADYCCRLDHRPGVTTATALHPNFRPRLIRIKPDVPSPTSPPWCFIHYCYCPSDCC